MIIPVYQIGNTPGKGNAFFISMTSLYIQYRATASNL